MRKLINILIMLIPVIIYSQTKAQQSVTWNFTNSEKSKLTCIINYPSGQVTTYWENVSIADSYFSFSQYVTSGSTYLSSCRFVPN